MQDALNRRVLRKSVRGRGEIRGHAVVVVVAPVMMAARDGQHSGSATVKFGYERPPATMRAYVRGIAMGFTVPDV